MSMISTPMAWPPQFLPRATVLPAADRPQVLRAMAEAPGSSLRIYRSERKLSRFYKRELKQNPRKKLKAFILAMRTPAEVEAKVKELYTRPRSFLLDSPSSHRVACPGRRQAA